MRQGSEKRRVHPRPLHPARPSPPAFPLPRLLSLFPARFPSSPPAFPLPLTIALEPPCVGQKVVGHFDRVVVLEFEGRADRVVVQARFLPFRMAPRAPNQFWVFSKQRRPALGGHARTAARSATTRPSSLLYSSSSISGGKERYSGRSVRNQADSLVVRRHGQAQYEHGGFTEAAEGA